MTMVSRSHAHVPDSDFPGQYVWNAGPVAVSDAIPYWTAVPRIRSRFEGLAVLAHALPATKGDLLGILLSGMSRAGGGGCDVLRPLWAEEAMHRAYGFLRLAHARARRCGLTTNGVPVDQATACDREYGVARDLAARFAVLEAGEDCAARPCAAALCDIVAGLEVLFGRPAGVAVVTGIQAMSLPAYKRRALVLAANELVINSLLHAFPGHRTGVIEVSLTGHGTELASLRVADDGIGLADAQPNLDCGVAASLADLLEGELTYERTNGRTIATVAFPCFEPWCGPRP
jgi:hypothetical protein